MLIIFLFRATELIEQAGFKVGKSDGGLVTEAKPPVKWDKGNAAIYILKTAFGIHWSDNIRVIFAGDDLTDEDAMKALKVNNVKTCPFENLFQIKIYEYIENKCIFSCVTTSLH